MSLASLAAFSIALLVSALLTPAVRDFALRRRFVDPAGARKVHVKAVPRVGGIAFVSAFFIAVIAGLILSPELRQTVWTHRPRSFAFLGGAVAMALVGLVDDVRGLRARYKLALQLVIAGALCWAGFAVRDIALPGGTELHLGILGVPLTICWIVGVTNAMNLIDGLDGLAAAISEIALVTTFVLTLASGRPVLGMYTVALAGAVAGFLLYNFNPATIFMGDTGSLFLGYFLAMALPLVSRHPSSEAVDVMVPIVALGVPVADTLLAIGRRALRGRALFSPDRDHLHHRLLAKGFSQRAAVLVLSLVCVALGGAALAAWFGGFWVDLAMAAAIAVSSTFLLHRLGLFDHLDLRAVRRDRRRNVDLRAATSAIHASLGQATHLDHVVELFSSLAPAVSASCLNARIGLLQYSGELIDGAVRSKALRARFSVRAGIRRIGDLEVVWSDGRAQVDPDHAMALEEICDNLARTMLRVAPDVLGDANPTPIDGLLPVVDQRPTGT